MNRWMRFVIVAILAVLVGACSQGSDSQGSDPVQAINAMMSKGYSMTEDQKQAINELASQGKKLQAEGKKAEAQAAFDKALAMLNALAEADRFNKSE